MLIQSKKKLSLLHKTRMRDISLELTSQSKSDIDAFNLVQKFLCQMSNYVSPFK